MKVKFRKPSATTLQQIEVSGTTISEVSAAIESLLEQHYQKQWKKRDDRHWLASVSGNGGNFMLTASIPENKKIADEIGLRVAGYEWALREPGTIDDMDDMDDMDVMNAYERLFPGAKYTDDGFKAFELGVMDTVGNWMDVPVLALADMARLSGVSDAYLRQESIAGRFPKPLEGTGKNRRWSIRQYEAWMDSPKRGSRSNGGES